MDFLYVNGDWSMALNQVRRVLFWYRIAIVLWVVILNAVVEAAQDAGSVGWSYVILVVMWLGFFSILDRMLHVSYVIGTDKDVDDV